MRKWNEILEHAIVGKLVDALLQEEYRVVIEDQEDGITRVYVHDQDEDHGIPEGGYKMWVKLVPGNGADIISDYTTNLEKVLKPVNDFAAQFAD